ncbi:hypothetical protein ES703_75615 [subsurface metagenome]
MAYEPVTLQSRNQGLYSAVYIGRKGGKGHGEEGKGNHKGANVPALDPPFHDEVKDNYSPGKKDERFIQIGQGRMPNSHLV